MWVGFRGKLLIGAAVALSLPVVGWLVYLLTTMAGIPAASFYGMVGGLALWPHYTIVLLTGALLGKYYFAKRVGEKTWRRYTPVLAAGYYCGVGLIGMAAAAFALIGKAVTPLVF